MADNNGKKDILDKLAEEVDKIDVGGKKPAYAASAAKAMDVKKASAGRQELSDKRGKENKKKKTDNRPKKGKVKKSLLKKSLSARLDSAKRARLAEAKAKRAGEAGKKAEGELSMEELLKESPVEIPEVGDVLEGAVIDVSSSSVLLDLGPLGTGIVLGKETKDGLSTAGKLKIGDTVSATLTEIENEDGYIELSIREASCEKAWEDLEAKKAEQETITTKLLDANRGGLIVEVNGISGFLPVSQLSSKNYPRVEDGNKNKILEILKGLVGSELKVKVIDINREDEKLIVSEKAAFSDEEKKVISGLKAGDVIEGEVSGVVDFGAFVKFLPPSKKRSVGEKDKLEGLVHISELAWQLINDPREIIKKGDSIKAQIIGIDNARISLSTRALEKDPWKNVEKKYKVGKTVKGKVDKINRFGAFVYLDKNIHGLAHVSEFQEMYPGKRMDDVIKAGESYDWDILSIEPKEHRMGLVLAKNKKKVPDKKASNKQNTISKKEENKKDVKKEILKKKKTEGEKKKENKKSVK